MKLLTALSFILLTFPLSSEELSLMCIGDSITEGSKSHFTYRHFIDKYLNRKLKHVGPFEDKVKLRHAGRGGWSVQQIAPKFKSWYKSSPADIMILHANHNNFADKKPIPEIIQAQENIMREAHAINPRVIIFFATPIPALKLPKYSYLNELRQAQENLCKILQNDKIKIHLVRPEIGFKTTLLQKDKVHLKEAGANHMAKCFAEAINSKIKQYTP